MVLLIPTEGMLDIPPIAGYIFLPLELCDFWNHLIHIRGIGGSCMRYTFSIVDSIGKVSLEQWNALRQGPDDLFMDPRFLRAVEESMASEAKFWYALLYDDSRGPVASACFCLYPVDVAILGQPWLKSILTRARRLVRRHLHLPVLFCGLPVSCGQSHLRVAPDADHNEIVQLLNEILRRLATECRALLIVLKEFGAVEARILEPLIQMGYLRADSLPMNCFEPCFGAFDEFCASLRSHYRYRFRHSQRKFARADLIVKHLRGDDIVVAYTDDVHRLYEAVWERSENKLEKLPASFFRKLTHYLPDEARFTAVLKDNCVVAFSWGLLTPQRYQNIFVGVDYRLNEETDLYFNLMARDLDFALRQNVREILIGQSANDFKSRLGCQRQPLYIYITSQHRAVSWIMRSLSGWFFPKPASIVERRLFRDVERDQSLGDYSNTAALRAECSDI